MIEGLTSWVSKDPQTASKTITELQALLIEQAKWDVNTFTELVLKDEETGNPVVQAPLHRTFHKIADSYDRAIIWSHIESAKTMTLSTAKSLFKLGNNPNLRIAFVSASADQAKKPMKLVASYIEKAAQNDSVLRDIFPDLKPGKNWSETKITVDRSGDLRDPSIQALGVHGAVLGSRLDYVVLDDVLDFENTLTDHARKQMVQWFKSTIMSRMTKNGRIVMVGTAWHPEDLMHMMAREKGWASVRIPVISPSGRLSWPDRWPLERIEQAKSMGTIEFNRNLLCMARADSDARFRAEWINKALERGDGHMMPDILERLPSGYATITGVDIGARAKEGADPTCLFTIAIHPNGDREVINVQLGQWTGPEIIERIKRTHRAYLSMIFVENNAAQQFIVDFLKDSSAVPVRPFSTGKNKHDPKFGVESLAVEMENGKWIIPSKNGKATNPNVQKWIDQMLYYVPGAHTGDALMASWFAREGARDIFKPAPKIEVGRVSLSIR